MALLGAASPTLSGLRNRARVVVLFSPAGKVQGIQGMKWNAQRKFFGEPATVAGLAERNVTVVVVSDKKESWPRSLAIARPAGDVAKIRAAYHVSEGQFLAVLVGLLATAAADLSYAALVWNPMAGAALAKLATAFILLGWPQRSAAGVAVTAAVAWCAVQSYTGAIFVAVGVFTALLAGPAARRDWRAVSKNAAIVAAVVAVLQVPYAIHQWSNRFNDSGMSAVTGSVQQVLTGEEPLQLAKSWAGYAYAFTEIETAPWRLHWFVWVLVACAAVVASRFRRDLPLLAVILLPQVTAPWFASSMPSCALMYLRTASGSSAVDGVAYSAIGMLPSVVSTSASTARSSAMPATAKPVAVGGCACTTALTSGRLR
jgi:hypothetical protein